MALLKAAAVILAMAAPAACYQPSARDCVVSCLASDECLDGQECGSDGWCAAPPRAGRCQALTGDAGFVGDPDGPGGAVDAADPDARESIDAAPPMIDAEPPMIDAEPAPPTVTLRVVVSGRGRVLVDPGNGSCDGTQSTPGDCSFAVVSGTQVTLVPVETHQHWDFAGWTTGNCAGESGACTLDLDDATLAAAGFSDGGNDDDD